MLTAPEPSGLTLTGGSIEVTIHSVGGAIACLLVFASAAVLAGCGGESLTTGNGGANAGSGGGSGLAGSSPSSGGTSEDSGSADDSLVGTWKGYVESYQFASGSDAVLLVITDEVPHGRIVFGTGTAPTPATDPNIGYPPLADSGIFEALPYEGFEYTLSTGEVTNHRVRFKVSSTELWKDWCALQSPIETTSGYNCVPSGMFQSLPSACSWLDPKTGQWVPLDCLKLKLCTWGVCQCTASACVAQAEGDLAFDFDHAGKHLDGSVTIAEGVRNVRLDKQ